MTPRLLFFITVVISFILPANAQIRDIGKAKTEKPSSQTVARPKVQPKPKAQADTVYSHSVVRRNGWYEPLGVLTRQQQSHRSHSYMFTGRNSEGHWTRLETVDAEGRHVGAKLFPYLTKSDSDGRVLDRNMSFEWFFKLADACVFEMIPDAWGKEVVNERAYDRDGKIVYTFSMIPIHNAEGARLYVGSYKDYRGLMPEMRVEYLMDSTYRGFKSTEVLISIERDSNGHDRFIKFLDSKGNLKPNSESSPYARGTVDVFAERLEYDRDGRLISASSLDSVGEPMKNKYGYSTERIEWDTRRNLPIKSTYLDENGIMSESGDSWNGIRDKTVTTLYSYDEYSRKVKESFVDSENRPAVNNYGAHVVETIYDSSGNELSKTGYDVEGKTASYLGDLNKVTHSYDDKHRLIETRYYYSTELGPKSTRRSKDEYEYDAGGKLIRNARYKMNADGEEYIINLQEERETPDGKEIRTHDRELLTLNHLPGVGQPSNIILYRYDRLGREILKEIQDGYGNEIDCMEGWSRKVSEYIEKPDGSTLRITTRYIPGGEILDVNEEIMNLPEGATMNPVE